MDHNVPLLMELPPVNLNLIRMESFTGTGVLIDSREKDGLLPLFLLQLMTIRTVRKVATSKPGIRSEPDFMKLL
jgi:hypothetical protein